MNHSKIVGELANKEIIPEACRTLCQNLNISHVSLVLPIW